jgi:hypothetical protein
MGKRSINFDMNSCIAVTATATAAATATRF